MSLSPYAKKYARAIWGRMVSEGAEDLTDATLDRCLAPCVCGPMLIATARELRDAGMLSLQEDLQTEADYSVPHASRDENETD
jgi:hypothetical protein